MTKDTKSTAIALICLAFAGGLTWFILNWDQHALEIANIGVFFLKLLPFVFTLAGICFFPFERLSVPLKLLIVLSAFGVFFCYGVAKLIYYFIEKVTYQEFYLLLQLLTPLIILSLALAFRCGGMRTKDVAVFGTIAIIFMISGIEDLTSQFVRMAIIPGYTIPETWGWAQHMTVFLGRVLTKNEAYVFIGIHFIVIAVILYFAYSKNTPFKGWFKEKEIQGKNHVKEQ